MTDQYDRQHVESVLKRVGVPEAQRTSILSQIRFPVDLQALQGYLEPLGISHDYLVSRMGGSP